MCMKGFKPSLSTGTIPADNNKPPPLVWGNAYIFVYDIGHDVRFSSYQFLKYA